ncbi:MAG: acetyltransferase [Syntrophomonadaceae bacterium]|nr:acetyltransferase [Syntrophomonadaceae bacterium]
MKISGTLLSKHSAREKKRYMPGLDGLRAISVLAVIAYHLNISWTPGGFLGVGVFFTLSGYLITDQIMAHWQTANRIDLKDFWIRRIKRLIPGLFFMLGIVCLYLLLFDRSMLISLKGELLSAILYFNNWWLIFHNASYFESFGPPSPLGHLWSLAIEEQFYILWPLILTILLFITRRRSDLIFFTLLGAALSVSAMILLYDVGTDPSRVYYGTDTRAFALLIGAALAMACPSQSMSRKISRKSANIMDLIGTVCLFGIILAMVRINEYDPFLYLGGLALFTIIVAVITAVLAHPASILGRIIGCKPLRWIGVRSYSLYLWHFPVIILTSPSIHAGGINVGLVIGQLVTTFLLAHISYKYIEEPFRRGSWSDWLTKIPVPNPLILRYASVMVIIALTISLFTGHNMASSHTHAGSPKVVENVNPDPTVPVDNTPLPTADEKILDNNTPDEIPPADNSPIDGPEVKTDAMITVIGDSVVLAAAPYLEDIFPGIIIDGELGRQMHQAQDTVNRLRSEGKLGRCVIIELGSNGPFKLEEFRTMLTSLEDAEQIIIVNTRVSKRWQDTVNSDLAKVGAEFPQATLVDWYSASEGKDSYFYGDGVHLSPQGAQCYAALISDAIK